MFAIAVLVTFLGCAVLFLDVVVTKKTDLCQEEVPAVYVGDSEPRSSSRTSFFVLAVPEFRYRFEGREYRGRSANVFFHLFLRRNQLAVPFVDGKTYRIFVNPACPASYVTDGEQRFAFLHVVGFLLAAIGILLLMMSMGFFG